MNILNDTNFSLLENFDNSPEAQYKEYLQEHIKNVQKGFELLKQYAPELIQQSEISEDELSEIVSHHDESKWSVEEYEPYAEHFYGKNKGKENDPDFDRAWEHHYKNNPHHPEYWDNSDMPFSSIIEMICDWWSFGWKDDKPEEIFSYWAKRKNDKSEIELTKTTIDGVERVLKEVKKILGRLGLEKSLENKSLSEAVLEIPIETYPFKTAEKLIKQSDNIYIVRHISPDADAKNSAFVLSTAIRQKYPNKPNLILDEESEVSLKPNDLLIILDLDTPSRFAGKITGNCNTLRIDHHPGKLNANVLIQDINAGSTCELVTLFLNSQNYQITKEMAEQLFIGIITDTGRLQYSLNQTTLAAISILTSKGIDYKKIYSQMYIKNKDDLKSRAYILSNYKTLPNGTAYLFLDKSRANAADIDLQKTAEKVYELGEIKGSPIWIILKENSHGEVNMRIRSRIIPINQIAELYGGGGHDNAAGLKVANRDEAKKFLIKIDDYLGEMKKKIPHLK